MKKLIIIILLIVGCKEKDDKIMFLTVGFQVDYYPRDKNKTGIYNSYTKYGQGINLSYDTSIKYNDTVVLTYYGMEQKQYKFVRKIAGWEQLKVNKP